MSKLTHYRRIIQIVTIATALSLSACFWHRERITPPPPYFSVGSTQNQVFKSMGAPSRITLNEDVEFWHYGDSWIAFSAKRVVKYLNRGALRVEALGTDGMPTGIDAPAVIRPDEDNIRDDVANPQPIPPAFASVRTTLGQPHRQRTSDSQQPAAFGNASSTPVPVPQDAPGGSGSIDHAATIDSQGVKGESQGHYG